MANKPLNTVRVCLTIPGYMYAHLVTRSTEQGRSISNLCAFIIEKHFHENPR
jgi:hypothetical protein